MLRRLYFARLHRPYTIALAIMLPIPGALAVICGDRVSAALSNIAAEAVSRSMGALLLIGSLLVIMGVARGRHILEVSGLAAIAAGLGIYGLGVIVGLGLQGMVAGPIALAVAAGSVLRIIGLGTRGVVGGSKSIG